MKFQLKKILVVLATGSRQIPLISPISVAVHTRTQIVENEKK